MWRLFEPVKQTQERATTWDNASVTYLILYLCGSLKMAVDWLPLLHRPNGSLALDAVLSSRPPDLDLFSQTTKTNKTMVVYTPKAVTLVTKEVFGLDSISQREFEARLGVDAGLVSELWEVIRKPQYAQLKHLL